MNQQNLLAHQYQDSSKLEARIELHRKFSTSEQSWPSWVFDQFALPADCRILDVGCGPAMLWQENAERIPAGWAIVLSDFSTGMIAQARENLSAERHKFAFEVFGADDIPFADESFEAVVANHMLYHVPELDKALAEIQRVLKPGGSLYASTNGVNHLKELDNLAPDGVPNESVGQVIASFTLENGADILAPYFSGIAVRKHADSLIVTEAPPLVAYQLSRLTIFTDDAEVDDQRRQAFMDFVEANMQEQGGAIQITKESGIFIATRA